MFAPVLSYPKKKGVGTLCLSRVCNPYTIRILQLLYICTNVTFPRIRTCTQAKFINKRMLYSRIGFRRCDEMRRNMARRFVPVSITEENGSKGRGVGFFVIFVAFLRLVA